MSEGPEVALVTPRGQGGIAVLLLSGAGSEDVLARVFRPKRSRNPAPGEIALGKLEDRSGLVDEVLVANVAEEGRPRYEVSCHGGPGVARRALAALVEAGAVERPASEIACSSKSGCATVVEAHERVPLALTELAAKVLLSQAAGRLSSRVDELLSRSASGDATALEADLAALERTAMLGIACSVPPRVVFTGRPNAGKSSLFNALLGRDRAIVSPEPGTTRDALEEAASIEGLPVRLVDLAGVRDSQDEVERQGVRRGAEEARLADLELLVLDLSVAFDAETRSLVAERAGRAPERTLAVLSKRDLLSPELRAHARTKVASALPESVRVLEVSSKTGEGLSALRRALVSHLAGTSEPEALAPGAVVFTGRQRTLVRKAREALSRGEREGVVGALRAMKEGEPEHLP